MLEDLRANGWSLRPCCMVVAYRIAHFAPSGVKKNIINNLWAAPVLVMYRLITECLFGYEIQAAASIGRRFTIHHGYGVVINKHVVAGMILPYATASLSAILAPTIHPVRSSVTALSWGQCHSARRRCYWR